MNDPEQKASLSRSQWTPYFLDPCSSCGQPHVPPHRAWKARTDGGAIRRYPFVLAILLAMTPKAKSRKGRNHERPHSLPASVGSASGRRLHLYLDGFADFLYRRDLVGAVVDWNRAKNGTQLSRAFC